MRFAALYLALGIASMLTAGCSGSMGGGGFSPAGPANASPAGAARVVPHDNGCGNGQGNGIRAHDDCHTNYQLIAPLQYDGTIFSELPYTACSSVNVGSAPVYTAPADGPVTVSGKMGLMPICAPNPLPARISIVGVQVKADGKSGRYRADPHGFVDVADAVYVTSSRWGFAPASPGLTLTQGSTYEFFIATPGSGN